MKINKKGNVLVAALLAAAVVLIGGYAAYRAYVSQSGQAPADNAPVFGNKNQNPTAELASAVENTAAESKTSPTASLTDFVKYKAEKTAFNPKLPDYKLGLSDLANFSAFEKDRAFTAAQKNELLKNNFFIAANTDKFYSDDPDGFANPMARVDDWVDLYGRIGGGYSAGSRNPENSVFITSDFLLHAYHRLIEKEFEAAEQASFYPNLKTISDSLLKLSAASYGKTTDAKQKESFERLSAYFLVSAAILDNAADDYQKYKTNNFVPDSQSDAKEKVLSGLDDLALANGVSKYAKDTAKQEINLIFAAKDIASSPLFGKYQSEAGLSLPEDYTQYNPRSHYAKNAILRDYFRAMMWYGRTNFLLSSPELTQDAANISMLVSSDNLKKWESIYLPTAFFVGQSDDLSLYDYRQAIDNTGFGKSGQNRIDKLQEELKTYKNPQIMSSAAIGNKVFGLSKEELQNKTKGFRFMGQRFTPDAFIFSSLTQGDELPDPKTGQSLPSMPTALMVSTLMGGKTSQALLDDWIKANAPKSDKIIADKMAKLEDYFGKISLGQWTQNIYWSWLYTLKSVLTDKSDKTGYPVFAKNDSWNKKNLQCFLGSWTELKHDTLLYAKQSYAEMGGGGYDEEVKPVVKGYVEPNIDFFDRLISLVSLSRDGLKQYDLLPGTFEQRNETLLEALRFYRKIAVAQLQNEKISDDDFEKLRLSAGSLGSILGPVGGEELMEKDARAALIADVHTDVAKGQILYEANGIPNYIYVAVKDANGARLTKGLVYSYYEFAKPLGKRLTDADWQQWSYSEKQKIPAMADWNKSLIK